MKLNALKTFTLWLSLLSVIMAEEPQPDYELTYEVFSLPLAAAADLRRENLGGVKMHARLIGMLENKNASQETFLLCHLSEKQDGRASTTEEFIYPTEPEPDHFMGPKTPPAQYIAPLFALPRVAQAYDSKNLGETVEASISKSEKGLLLRIQAKHVSLLGLDAFGTGVSRAPFPRFGVQKITASSQVALGRPFLIGTVSPKIAKAQKPGERQIWLAWATVTLSKK